MLFYPLYVEGGLADPQLPVKVAAGLAVAASDLHAGSVLTGPEVAYVMEMNYWATHRKGLYQNRYWYVSILIHKILSTYKLL